MLLGILLFEWRYQTRRLTFLAVAAAFAFVGGSMAATRFGAGIDGDVNSPYAIVLAVSFATLVAVLATTFCCAQGALRDTEHGMTEIVYATAITRRHYVFGRFAGVFAAAATAFAFLFPAMLAGTFAIGHDPGRLASFSLKPYLWAAAVIAVPNLMLVCALLFTLALLTRSALAVYVGGVFAYVLYFIVSLVAGSPIMAGTTPPSAEAMAIAALADPFGLSAFFEQTRYWTPAERDLRLPALAGHLLANRLIWLTASALLLMLAYRRFAFRLPSAGRDAGVGPTPEPTAAGQLRPVAQVGGARAALAAFADATRLELRHALRGWPFPALLIGFAAISLVELAQSFRNAEFGTALLPATFMVQADLSEAATLFGLLLLSYFAGELVWRERTAGMAEIVDATPVPNGALLAAKLTALGVLAALLLGVAGVVAMLFQLFRHWTQVQPALHAGQLALVGLPLLLAAVLGLCVQTLVPNRYLGILATALILGFWQLGAVDRLDHPLLRYAGLPEVSYTDLAGFGPELASYGWLALYWSAFALLLLVLAGALWRRGTDLGLRARLAAFRVSKPARWLALGTFALFATSGGVIYHQAYAWNGYLSPDDAEAWKAAYERGYRHLETLPQPTPISVEAEVDLRPEERRYQVHGRLLLENKTKAAIPELWVSVRRDVAHLTLKLDGRETTEHDALYGIHRFVLAPPLAPGARIPLDYELAVERRGVKLGGADRDVVANGSLLLRHHLMPGIGYRCTYELASVEARQRQGLPLRRQAETHDAGEQQDDDGSSMPMDLDFLVRTAPGQTVVGPGVLAESGEREGRPYFRYRSKGTLSRIVAFSSARYQVARRDHASIALEVYHHPGHDRNVEAMLDAAAHALDYCVANFGPYSYQELRIVEVPATMRRGSAFASPGTIFVVEDKGFLTDRSDPWRIDVVSKRVAHEVAHQWWGYQVSPAPRPGASTLVETLARYTELRVLAGLHGEEALPPVHAIELDRYLRGRSGDRELPLRTVEDQAYVFYAKGALVMAAIRDLVGEAATNEALRRLLADVAPGRQPVAADLQRHLEDAAANEADRALIRQWWQGIVLYDLRVAKAQVHEGGLSLRIDARKRDEAQKADQDLPLDEEIEIALYADEPSLDRRNEPPLQTFRRRLHSGEQELQLDGIDPAARYVLLDPNLLRIDRNRLDNLRKIDLP
jgi:ABC-2 type transport system permease protein